MASVADARRRVLFPGSFRTGLVGVTLGIVCAYQAQGASTLLLQKQRVEVSITWRSQYSGETGSGIAIPVSDGFGFFAFTDPSNPEVFVKVLDFGSSSPLLLFYGGLTDFEYHLTFHNRCTGQDVRLDKAAGTFDGAADNRSMLAGCEQGPTLTTEEAAARAGAPGADELPPSIQDAKLRLEQMAKATEPLAINPTLYLSKDRVEVSLTWRSQYDGSTGTGIATQINSSFGFLSFFNAENPEVFVKVLDFGSTSPLLLFYGGLTDFEYEVTYKNACTGQTVVFRKPPGSYAGGADNRSMMAVCAEAPLPPDLAAVKAVEQRLQTLLDSGASKLEAIRGVGAYMATRSEYTASKVNEAGLFLTGILTDGMTHVVSLGDDFGESRASTLPPAARGIAPLTGGLVPTSGYARVLNAFHGDLNADSAVSDLVRILTAGGYGIRANQTDANVAALREIKDDGYFYFNTHGGGEYFTNPQSTSIGYYSLMTNTPVNLSTFHDPLITADRQDHRLTYHTGDTVLRGQNTWKTGTYWGINKNFVKDHWRFSENAIVYLLACVALNSAGGPQDFADAILNAGNGAGVVFSYTGLSFDETGYRAARYFTDRLLGTNAHIGDIHVEQPEQRPFPWKEVYDDMLKNGLARAGNGVDSDLVYKARSPQAVLDPSIREVLVNENDKELILLGDFGKNDGHGRVSVGAKKRQVCGNWTPEKIVCPLPLTGDGSKGDVLVEIESVQGRWKSSNVRQLNEWKIPLKYKWIFPDSPYRIEGDGELRYRADVAPYRKKPGEDPFYPLRGMVPTPDSYLMLTASGIASSSTCTGKLEGIARFESPTKAAGLPYQLISAMQVETRSHLASIALDFGANPSPFRITWTGTSCPPEPTRLAPVFGEMDGQQTFASPDPNRPDTGPYFSRTIFMGSGFQIPQDYRPAKGLPGLEFGWDQLVAPDPPFDTTLPR